MTLPPDIRPQDAQIVKEILQQNLPENHKIYVFGSRATGKTKKSSDLDLAIDLGRPMTKQEQYQLHDSFEDSDLPYKVDIVDLHNVSDEFRKIIAQDKTLFIY